MPVGAQSRLGLSDVVTRPGFRLGFGPGFGETSRTSLPRRPREALTSLLAWRSVRRRIGGSRGTLTALLILAIVVLGLVAGWVAQIVLGSGGRQIDWGLALVAGLVGSFVGGLLASLIAGDGLRLRPSGLIGSIVGAVLFIAVVRMMRGRSRA